MLLKFILLFTLEFQILRIFIFLQFKIIQIKVTFGSRVINRSESRPDVALFAKNVFATRSESPTTNIANKKKILLASTFSKNIADWAVLACSWRMDISRFADSQRVTNKRICEITISLVCARCDSLKHSSRAFRNTQSLGHDDEGKKDSDEELKLEANMLQKVKLEYQTGISLGL